MKIVKELVVVTVLLLSLGVILKAIFGVVTAVLYLALIYFCWKFVSVLLV